MSDTNLNEALETVRHYIGGSNENFGPKKGEALAALSQIEARLGRAEEALRRVEEVSDLAGVRVARNYFTEEGS